MSKVNIALLDDLDLFIRKKIESGAYASAANVVADVQGADADMVGIARFGLAHFAEAQTDVSR